MHQDTAKMPRPTTVALLKTSAVCVATILGSGILGLPVSMYRSGVAPFLVTFTFTLVAQIGIVYATAEILQRAQLVRNEAAAPETPRARPRSYSFASADLYNALPYRQYSSLTNTRRSRIVEDPAPLDDEGKEAESTAPTLHTFAELYLPHVSLRVFFEVAVVLHFISIMSSYALGAPQAFREVFPVFKKFSETSMVLGFAGTATLIVMFYGDAALGPLTIATFFKGGLITILVFIVLGIGTTIKEQQTTDWGLEAGVEPFLIGTLALSGVVNLMPKLWEICIQSTGFSSTEAIDYEFVSSFRAAVNAAVILCYFINILWSVGVLLCVPQGVEKVAARTVVDLLSSVRTHADPQAALPWLVERFSEVGSGGDTSNVTSLAAANAAGEISTIPLVETLKGRATGNTTIILDLINLFIFVSVSVSFLIFGIGMKHMMDDIADEFVYKVHGSMNLPGSSTRSARRTYAWRMGARVLFSGGAFVSIIVLATSNPSGLLKIMAGITSLCINAEGGLLIMVMLATSRWAYYASESPKEEVIVAPMSRFTASAWLVYVILFYIVAVVIDIVEYLPTLFT